MSTPSAEDVIKSFSHVVRKKLEEGETVEVPGLGTFSVEHHPSEQKQGPDGETYMEPPRDIVTFEPEQ